MKYAILFLLCLTFINLSAQKYFHQIPYGYEARLDLGFGISILDFNNGQVTTYPYAESENFGMGDSGSFICDHNGELLLMTNNCEVKSKNLESIEGGSIITPLDGQWDDDYCDGNEYPQKQGTLLLPELSNDSIYYLLHKNMILSFPTDGSVDVFSDKLFISTIAQRSDLSFYVKEKKIILEDTIRLGSLTATPHIDKKKWWLSFIGHNSNKLFTTLIGGDSIIQQTTFQQIGDTIFRIDAVSGQNIFSPQGDKMAINNSELGIMLYDFDPATGLFSNYRNIKHTDRQYSHELAFSPSGRFLYSTTTERLLQFDLQSDNVDEIKASKYNLGHIRTVDDTGWPVGIGSLHLGPDCRIYVAPGTTSHYMHVIHQPDQKGAACMYEERAIRTPTNVLHDFPNIPNYHYLSPCDSTIEWGILSTSIDITNFDQQISAFPNPVYDQLRLEWSVTNKLAIEQWVVYDLLGKIIQSGKIEQGRFDLEINTLSWNSGTYFVQLLDEQGGLIAVRKIIKQE